VSSTPVILSHSGPDGIYEHARNVPDDLLLQLAKSGGVIHVNAFPGYLEELQASPEREAAMEALAQKYGSDYFAMSESQKNAYNAERSVLDKAIPAPSSSFEKYMEHLLYTINLVGVDHVGIGADWDGGGGVDGMSDVTFVPKITHGLVEAGISTENIEKIWSGNLLRLMRTAEQAKSASLSSPKVVK